MKLFVLALSTVGLLCAASLPTSAQTCSIRSISVPGASVTLGYGVNKYDTVVGSYAIGTSQNFHAYRWSNGNFSSYMYPNAVSTEFRRNNDSGVIVGTYKTSAGRNHGFELANGQAVSFDYPGAYNTFATGINNSGTIVGYFTTSATGAAAGFRKTSGGWTALRFPNAKATFAWAVSDTGEIVGTYLDVSGHLHGFTYMSGTFTNVDYPGATDTEIHGVNKYGNLVGALPEKDSTEAWQRKGSTYSGFNWQNANIISLDGLNNLGDEVGSANLGSSAPAFLRVCH